MSVALPNSDARPQSVSLNVNSKSVYAALLGAIALLLLLSSAAKAVMLMYPAEQYGAVNELCKRFYLDFENNIPAWFSTLGLFLSATLLAVIACCHRVVQKKGFWQWLGLAVIFLCLAVDEATYLHEILIVSLRNKLQLTGIFYFAWVIPGAGFVVSIVLAYLPFVWRLPKQTRNGLLIAGACYVGGALGMELLGGMLAESKGFDAASYILVMSIEESLEMIGIATLIYVLLRYLGDLCTRSLQLRLG